MVKNDKTPLFHHKFVYLKRFKVNYLVMSWTTWSGFQVAQFATWKFGRALSTESSLVQVMAWCQAENEPLPEAIMTKVSELASLIKLMAHPAASNQKQSNFVNQVYSVFDRVAPEFPL